MANQGSPLVIAVRYPELYGASRGILQDLLSLLHRETREPKRWPTRVKQRIVFANPNSSHLENYSEEIPSDAIGAIQSELSELESYKQALAALERLQKDGKAIPSFFPIDSSFLIPLLGDYLDKKRDLIFDEEIFREVYNRVENYIGGETVQFKVYLIIWGMTGSEGEVRLSNTHRIFRVDEPEIHRAWASAAGTRGFRLLWPHQLGWPHPGTYLMEMTLSCLKNELNNLGILLGNEVEKCIRAARLASIGSSFQYMSYEEVGFIPPFATFGLPAPPRAGGWSCELTTTTLKVLMQSWPTAFELSSALALEADKMPAHMRISAARFSSSFDKTLDEDRLIDYFIAFEALFTKENDAISYRLPLRVAVFIGDDPADRTKIFETVRAGYDIRSNLAHGKSQLVDMVKVGSQKTPVREFIDELRRILFQSVHRFAMCRTGKTKDVIIKAVDDSVVSQDRSTLQKLWL